jgi:hypothetical protein
MKKKTFITVIMSGSGRKREAEIVETLKYSYRILIENCLYDAWIHDIDNNSVIAQKLRPVKINAL